MLHLLDRLVVSSGHGLELGVGKLELLELLLHLLPICLKLVALLKQALQGLLDLRDPCPVLLPGYLLGGSGLLCLGGSSLLLPHLLPSLFELGLERLKLR